MNLSLQNFFQGYILPKKFKIDKRILHLSCLIRNNELTRNDAIDKLKMPHLETQKIKEYQNYFKKNYLYQMMNFIKS